MYNIELSHSASKFIENLKNKNKSVCERIENTIDSLKTEPLKGKKLTGELSYMRALRVGDYRILYAVIASRILIQIIKIGHRREIYR